MRVENDGNATLFDWLLSAINVYHVRTQNFVIVEVSTIFHMLDFVHDISWFRSATTQIRSQ